MSDELKSQIVELESNENSQRKTISVKKGGKKDGK